MKLFSQNSNVCDHDTSTSQTDGQTDRRTTCHGNTALRVASRGNKNAHFASVLMYCGSITVGEICENNIIIYDIVISVPISKMFTDICQNCC